MAENIGSWHVSLSANASGLVQGLDVATKRTGDFTKQMQTGTAAVAAGSNRSFGQMASQAKMHGAAMSAMAAGSNRSFGQMASLMKSQAASMATGVNNSIASVGRVDLSQASGGIGKLFGTIMGAVSGFSAGPIVGTVTAVATLMGSLIAFSSSSMDAIATQAKLGKQIGVTAQEVAGLQVLANRSGVAPETVSHSLSMWALQVAHLNQELASGHAGPIVTALDQMGISAREFKSQSMPEQLAQIAEGSLRIENVTDRNAAVFAVLGRHARDLAPMLKMPADELRDMAGVASKVGYNISQADATQVAATVRQLKDGSAMIGAMFSNLGQSAAVMFAPVASTVGDTIKLVVTEAMPLIKLFAGIQFAPLITLSVVLTGIVGAVRLVMPILSALGRLATTIGNAVVAEFDRIKPVVMELVTSIGAMFGDASNPVETFAGWIEKIGPGCVLVVQVIGKAIELVVVVAGTLLKGLAANVAMVMKAVDVLTLGTLGLSGEKTVKVKVDEAAKKSNAPASAASRGLSEMSSEMERANKQIGKTREEKEMMQAQEKNYNAAQVAHLQRMQQARSTAEARDAAMMETNRRLEAALDGERTEEQRRAAERWRLILQGVGEPLVNAMMRARDVAAQIEERTRDRNAMRERANSIREATRTPLEAFQARMEDAQAMLENGMLSQANFGRESTAAYEAFMSSANRQDHGSPAAALAGTVEEQRAIAQAARDEQRSSRDPVERLRQVVEQQLQIQRDQRASMAEFVRLARDGFVSRLGN